MATKAKNQPKVEETTEAPKVVRPNDLAKQLEVDPKRLRAYLRQTFTRPADAKNTNWELSQEMIEAATARFTASDEEGDSDES